jgi:hypothetical protein
MNIGGVAAKSKMPAGQKDFLEVLIGCFEQ